jgi:hypothetical protein
MIFGQGTPRRFVPRRSINLKLYKNRISYAAMEGHWADGRGHLIDNALGFIFGPAPVSRGRPDSEGPLTCPDTVCARNALQLTQNRHTASASSSASPSISTREQLRGDEARRVRRDGFSAPTRMDLLQGWACRSRTNADDRLPADTLGRV